MKISKRTGFKNVFIVKGHIAYKCQSLIIHVEADEPWPTNWKDPFILSMDQFKSLSKDSFKRQFAVDR